MKRLFTILLAGAFLGASAPIWADDKTPAQPVDQAKLKAERDAAKSSAAKMTPEQKTAAKQAKRAKKQKEMASMEKAGQPNQPAKTEALEKSVETTKNDPKALPDAKAKQEALKQQQKAGPGQ